jgi:hypothetical protein
MTRPHAAPCLCVVIPASERFAHRDVRRVFQAEPFSDADLNRTAPTLRASTARRKAPRR